MATQLPSPPKKGAQHPQFSAHVCCDQTVGWIIKMPLSRKVADLGSGNIVLDGGPAPPKGHSPQFSAHVCCGQTAGWIKMPVGTEVGLGPHHIVIHGDPAPSPERAQQPPLFGPCLLWPNGRPSQLLLSSCLSSSSLVRPCISESLRSDKLRV